MPVTVLCELCSSSFQTWPSKLAQGRGRFCSRSCQAKAGNHRHGHSGNPTATYHSWSAMLQRCTNPKHVKYARYGAAGVTVDPDWGDFRNFLRDMGERPSGMTLDRKDGTRGYSRENCKWSTPTEQALNMRSVRTVVFAGKETTLSELSERLGVTKSTLANRMAGGWPESRWGEKPRGGGRPKKRP